MELVPTTFYTYYMHSLCIKLLQGEGVDLPTMKNYFDIGNKDVKTVMIGIKRIIASRPFVVEMDIATPSPNSMSTLSTTILGRSNVLRDSHHMYMRDMTPMRVYLKVADDPNLRLEHITLQLKMVYMDDNMEKTTVRHVYYNKDFVDSLKN